MYRIQQQYTCHDGISEIKIWEDSNPNNCITMSVKGEWKEAQDMLGLLKKSIKNLIEDGALIDKCFKSFK